MYQHFIITRFNLRKKGWEKTQGNTAVLTEQWMDNRLKLFENYCYSSCLSQVNINYEWLVFFDVATTEKHRKIIHRLANEFPLFIPIYIDGMDAFLPNIKSSIKKRLISPFLITSRLDNDDCISQDYVNEVQNQFSSQSYMAIDFIEGYTLQIEPEVKLGKHLHLYNPFISLIEKSEDFQTVWSRTHGGWGKIKNIQSIRNKPIWLSVIHKENKENRFVGFGDLRLNLLDCFNINSLEKESLIQAITPYSKWKYHSLINQLKIKSKTYFKLLKHRLRSFLNIIPCH